MNPLNKHLLNFGIINIDKPAGPTSYTISNHVRRKLKLSKASHMGTLDPKVTGVLPITLGRACKLAAHLITHDKDYVGILETHKEQDIKQLQELIDKHFLGKIQQIPPHKSAVKRAERTREVYSFKLIEGNGRSFLFTCSVEGGTYIRKICSDLGDMIGGAHMGDLRRTKAGIFDETTLVTLPAFEQAVDDYNKGNTKKLESMILPAETAIKTIMPCLQIEKRAAKALKNGKPLLTNDLVNNKKLDDKAIFAAFEQEELIGIYEKTKEKNVFGRPLFVYSDD